MNIFRLGGDLLHLASFVILLLKIFSTKSCRGISLKTQITYVVVFCARYLDLFWNFDSLYNSVMKVIFITLSVGIVYLMVWSPTISKTYSRQHDDFNLLFTFVPTFLLALVWNEKFTYDEVLWAWSIYLEAVAIIPQLIVLQREASETGFVDTLDSHYVFALGGYRALYLLNWIYRLATEPHYRNWIVWIAGLVQTAIYGEFFYYYIKARIEGGRMVLPM